MKSLAEAKSLDEVKSMMAINLSQILYDFICGNSDRKDLYDCIRHYWKTDLEQAREVDLVLGLANEIVVAVFEPEEWHYTSNPNYPEHISFTGKEIFGHPFDGMRMPIFSDDSEPIIKYFDFRRVE